MTKGFVRLSGVYQSGEIFLQDKFCPMTASPGDSKGSLRAINIQVWVPREHVGSILAGLDKGETDLTIDTVPTLMDQSLRG